MPYKPDGFPDLSPYLIVRDMASTLAFLRAVFQVSVMDEHCHPDGRTHVSLKIGDSVLMVGQAVGEYQPAPCHVHLYVPDPLAVYEQALALGATSLQLPEPREDGHLRGGFLDLNQTGWWVGCQHLVNPV